MQHEGNIQAKQTVELKLIKIKTNLPNAARISELPYFLHGNDFPFEGPDTESSREGPGCPHSHPFSFESTRPEYQSVW